jgi:hypothetical protein
VFDFLGFRHLCGTTRKTGRFIVKRKTIRKRLAAKLGDFKRLPQLADRWIPSANILDPHPKVRFDARYSR